MKTVAINRCITVNVIYVKLDKLRSNKMHYMLTVDYNGNPLEIPYIITAYDIQCGDIVLQSWLITKKPR